ncbi:MAG: hypothetical protein H6Q00_2420 [Holophagaceae bacterium]|nr:hypothetical protein [Holophagaceae bacterium]
MPELFDIAVLGEDESSELYQLLRLCGDVVPQRFLDGEYLIRQDEPDQDLFIVLKGVYSVEQPPLVPGGPPVILASVTCDPLKVAIVGEMAYFGDQRRTASVRSAGVTYALRLKPAHIDVIIGCFPMLTKVICQQFARRLKEANDAIRAFQSRFALVSTKRMVSAGELLFSEGDLATAIHQVVAGQVEIRRGAHSALVEAQDAASGFLEPEAYLGMRPHQTSACAHTDAILVSVDREHVDTLIRCYPELATRLG